jgi:hypothetical protein
MRGVAERIPSVRRYALVANDSNDGVRRFHLARVAAPRAERLERMEDVAERERRDEAHAESCAERNKLHEPPNRPPYS